jgi:hypothetical protein
MLDVGCWMLDVEELAGVSELRCGFSTEDEETSRVPSLTECPWPLGRWVWQRRMGWKRAPLNGAAEARDGKETLGAPVVRAGRSSVRCEMEWSIVLDLLGWSEPAFRTLLIVFPEARCRALRGRKIDWKGAGGTKGML